MSLSNSKISRLYGVGLMMILYIIFIFDFLGNITLPLIYMYMYLRYKPGLFKSFFFELMLLLCTFFHSRFISLTFISVSLLF